MASVSERIANAGEWVVTGFGPGAYWLPVGLGVGVGIYFAWPTEPVAAKWMLAAGLAGALWLTLRLKEGLPGLRRVAGGAAAILLGVALAALRTSDRAAPVLTDETRTLSVSGRVVEVERFGPTDGRLLLSGVTIDGVLPDRMPTNIRLRVRGAQPAAVPGDIVRTLARLGPPRPPDLPGGFDYPRLAYFRQLGAVGFTLAPVEIVRHEPGGWNIGLERIRDRIARRIRAVLPGDEGALLAAFLVGRRDGLSEDAQEHMRQAGLTHILSISGLHMGMVAAAVYLLSRALLAAAIPLSRSRDVRGYAAGMGLFAVSLYLLLSDMSVPPLRSWIMVGLGLVALIFLRRPFSLRLVSVAAVVVLATSPEALIEPGFQMSFAATIALIAAYQGFADWRAKRRGAAEAPDPSILLRVIRFPFAYALGLAATTLIASAATAPFSVYHFGRASLFGVAANAIVVPLMGVFLMPFGLLALILMPFGLDAPVLEAMRPGLALVLDAAARFADGRFAAVAIPAFPAAALGLIGLGGVMLCFSIRLPQRGAGVALMLLGAVIGWRAPAPDLLISEGGGVGWVADGRLVMESKFRAKTAQKSWAVSLALPEIGEARRVRRDQKGECDRRGCWVDVKGRRVAIVRDYDALLEDCRAADFLINLTGDPAPCARPESSFVDRSFLERNGAVAVRFPPGRKPVTLSAAEARGIRPWSAPEKFGIAIPPPVRQGGSAAKDR